MSQHYKTKRKIDPPYGDCESSLFMFFGFVILLQLFEISRNCLLFLRATEMLGESLIYRKIPADCFTFKGGNIQYQSLSKVKGLGNSNKGCWCAVAFIKFKHVLSPGSLKKQHSYEQYL